MPIVCYRLEKHSTTICIIYMYTKYLLSVLYCDTDMISVCTLDELHVNLHFQISLSTYKLIACTFVIISDQWSFINEHNSLNIHCTCKSCLLMLIDIPTSMYSLLDQLKRLPAQITQSAPFAQFKRHAKDSERRLRLQRQLFAFSRVSLQFNHLPIVLHLLILMYMYMLRL